MGDRRVGRGKKSRELLLQWVEGEERKVEGFSFSGWRERRKK